MMTVIEVQNLHKSYRDQVAVQDVSFSVERGEIFGILGPNGAGKTTTVESIGGLRKPDRGTVRVLGLDPQRDRAELRQRLGMQLQESALPDRIKVWEALALYSSFYRQPANQEALIRDLGLEDKRNTTFDKLSGGQRQRLSIALALVGNPEIAILDELTTGLDPQARRDTWKLIEGIRDQGVTVLLVTHSMEEAEHLCDRLAIIAGGRVVAVDSPAGLVERLNDGQRIYFRPSVPLDEGELAGLPEVRGVRKAGEQIQVSGGDNLLEALSAFLAKRQVTAAELHLERASLEDAFVALTGQALEEGS
jgi:ABC-2 type transport system ATP-binding protein